MLVNSKVSASTSVIGWTIQVAYADDFNKKSAEQTASARAIAQLGISDTKEEKTPA